MSAVIFAADIDGFRWLKFFSFCRCPDKFVGVSRVFMRTQGGVLKTQQANGTGSRWPSEIQLDFPDQVRVLEFRRGESIYAQGQTPQGIYFIETGLVGLVKVGAQSGKEHLLRLFREGQFFGHRSLFSEEGYHASSVALQTTRLRLVPRSVIYESLKKKPDLLFEVVQVLSRELRRCEDQHVMILENDIRGRVAQSLIYLKDLHPDHRWTRQEIANFCGSTVSTVIKTLADFERQGWVAQSGREITVLKRDALVALQDEDLVSAGF